MKGPQSFISGTLEPLFGKGAPLTSSRTEKVSISCLYYCYRQTI